ncbi:aldehyde dehydrogenase family protein [Saccharomonospora viridis]|uniref:NAD-dependent aldehyde dehydrogenase n=1 Tax=Saccharomonospora viridis (strain ATCC 15386 / DSM 43017 / JCM 3036 / CCUG 5913 / NBRC 12207 / NCIMB 9602 / P101) TaxID=471857 RepID=C7MT85_SACVD|nr:aldehyde dehydrogenase family protein [Saccharomonospora viridis]ACU96722.1 NAD-dependent aldehyde dehydrogenase [Saccharomonospora viridis DSM 43017]
MTDLAVELDLPSAEPADPNSIRIENPVDGSLVGRVAMATPEEVAGAVAEAKSAFPGWAATSADQRAAALRAAADALADRAADLAKVNAAETGRPVAEAREGVLAGVSTLRQYAELGPLHRGRSLLGGNSATDLMVPEPRGVVAVLTPWNDPVAVACGLVGAALVTGNTVVAKPSERCPHTGLLFGEVLRPHFPEGVVRHLAGDGTVGAWLAGNADLDVIAHVGSTTTGRELAAVAAGTGAKVLLENGGNDPLLVDGDVDPVWAAEQAATGAFANSGQICVAVERIFVHRDVAAAFLDALIAAAERTGMSPLVDARHRDAVHEQVTDAVAAGARLQVGGVIPDGPGSLYPATVLTDCEPGMRVWREETFGPVAPVCVVADFAEGLARARDDDYGLAATVLTRSMEHAQRAWRELPVGTVKVNSVFGGAPGGAAHPRRASGHGYGYGPELLDEFTATKVVHIEPAPAP